MKTACNALHAGLFVCYLSAAVSSIFFHLKVLSKHAPLECQIVWIQIRPKFFRTWFESKLFANVTSRRLKSSTTECHECAISSFNDVYELF